MRSFGVLKTKAVLLLLNFGLCIRIGDTNLVLAKR